MLLQPTVALSARRGAAPVNYQNSLSTVNALYRLVTPPQSLSWWQAYLQAAELARSCDGLLLSGGGDPHPALYGCEPDGTPRESIDLPLDILELALIEAFTAARKPVLGICRGLQILNVAFGGRLIQDLPGHGQVNCADGEHEIGLSVTPPGSELAALIHNRLGGGGTTLSVNTAHHQAVDGAGGTGGGLTVWALSRDGAAEGLAHISLPVAGVQWHPERHEVTREAVFSSFVSFL